MTMYVNGSRITGIYRQWVTMVIMDNVTRYMVMVADGKLFRLVEIVGGNMEQGKNWDGFDSSEMGQ